MRDQANFQSDVYTTTMSSRGQLQPMNGFALALKTHPWPLKYRATHRHLCAREVGMTNHPPLKIEPALKTARNFAHTLHKQHTINTQQFTRTAHTAHKCTHQFTTQVPVSYSCAHSWDLWDRPIPLPLRHSARGNPPPFRQVIQLGFLFSYLKVSSSGSPLSGTWFGDPSSESGYTRHKHFSATAKLV